jgi:SAM-dependent methyltransferase
MRDTFWNAHYQAFTVSEPSGFARHCLKNYLRPEDTVVELGCGNGRDGFALGQSVSRYVGLDACAVAVGAFQSSAAASNLEGAGRIEVRHGDFTDLDFNTFGRDATRLVIYSRFSLHAITYGEADRLLANIGKITCAPWMLLLEARTIHDVLYGEGTKVGLHEFQTDHYRRFIDPDVFLADMASRYSVRYFEVAPGFAPFGDQDPVLMRAVIQPRAA